MFQVCSLKRNERTRSNNSTRTARDESLKEKSIHIQIYIFMQRKVNYGENLSIYIK